MSLLQVQMHFLVFVERAAVLNSMLLPTVWFDTTKEYRTRTTIRLKMPSKLFSWLDLKMRRPWLLSRGLRTICPLDLPIWLHFTIPVIIFFYSACSKCFYSSSATVLHRCHSSGRWPIPSQGGFWRPGSSGGRQDIAGHQRQSENITSSVVCGCGGNWCRSARTIGMGEFEKASNLNILRSSENVLFTFFINERECTLL